MNTESHNGDFSIEALAEATGVPVRTVRFYITEGLLPGPGSRGKSASYRPEHLARLRLIRLLVGQRLPLAEIRAALSPLSDVEVDKLLAREEQRAASLERSADTTSPQAYIAALLANARAARTHVTSAAPRFQVPAASPYGVREATRRVTSGPDELWQRIQLAPGVELHVSAAARGRYAPLLERLRQVAEEEISGEH